MVPGSGGHSSCPILPAIDISREQTLDFTNFTSQVASHHSDLRRVPAMQQSRLLDCISPRFNIESCMKWPGLLFGALLAAAASSASAQNVFLHGELRQWHKVTLTVEGPKTSESDTNVNPFTDYRFNVRFRHESGSPEYTVPGYFAADGNAAHSSASSGSSWRAHLSPDKAGQWRYTLEFKKGKNAAIDSKATVESVNPLHGRTGRFTVAATNKKAPDLRSRGRLRYVGRHHLQFAGSEEYFLKVGADSPESLLAFADFDGTESKTNTPARPGEAAPAGLHQYKPHLADWKEGDPTWKEGKGKGLIGALNYLASTGANAFSFLTYNAGGDGDNVWPFFSRNEKLHYDCSKLDQWQIIFDHAQKLGLYLHFKLQETEMDDIRSGHDRKKEQVPTALDGGELGPERKLYLREMIARFGYALALNWNLGEENTQSAEEQRAMAKFIRDTDPYNHHIVIHTFPDDQDRVYGELLGEKSVLTGASLQNNWDATHKLTLQWVKASAAAKKPWVVANDEQGPSDLGVPPDPGYQGHNGVAERDGVSYTMHDIRKRTLWGNLMAGGAGVEYYFGYKLPQNDLGCEDWRSREQSWKYGKIALEFFRTESIPFWEMENADALVGHSANDNSAYCLAQTAKDKRPIYLVYLPVGGSTQLAIENPATYTVHVFNPRTGEKPTRVAEPIVADGKLLLNSPEAEPKEDWLFLVKKARD